MTISDDPERRIVVTGVGCVSPLGGDLESTWTAAVAGRSGIAPITLFDVSDYAVGFGGGIGAEAGAISHAWKAINRSRVLVYKLGGKHTLPPI